MSSKSKAKGPFWTVPRLWPGATVVCVGSGPSLTQEQLDYVRGKAPVIVVNDNWKLAPWADVLYAADHRWWTLNKGVPDFHGIKVTIENAREYVARWPEIRILDNTGSEGIETKPTGLRTGRNGGYQAINLAAHFGPARILLVGYDMKPGADGRTHWFGDHAKWPTKAQVFANDYRPRFRSLPPLLRALGVEVVNCTPDSALDAFPRAPLESML